jgi:hypothetical protein
VSPGDVPGEPLDRVQQAGIPLSTFVPEASEACLHDKVAVALNACETAAKHYEDYGGAFTTLDGKAQATGIISGLVLAAVAAFFKDGKAPAIVSGKHCWIFLVLAPPVLALAAVITSLLGARVTEVISPFDSPEQIREAKNLADVDCVEFSQEHVLDYYRARLEHWLKALEGIRLVVRGKAKWILWCQRLMIASLVFLLVLYIVVLFKS